MIDKDTQLKQAQTDLDLMEAEMEHAGEWVQAVREKAQICLDIINEHGLGPILEARLQAMSDARREINLCEETI